MSNLKTGLVRTEREIITAGEQNPAQREAGTDPGPRADHQQRDREPHGEDRDRALRAIEARADELPAEANDRLDDLVRRDRLGTDARYLAAVADPDYASAFMKRIAGSDGAAAMLNQREQLAMERVGAAMAERAMQVTEGKYGGYAIPFALDPTIILTSTGAINPLRQLATVDTITASEWKGVSSAGVSAAFAKELAEVGDSIPMRMDHCGKPSARCGFTTGRLSEMPTSARKQVRTSFGSDARVKF
jgi:HK97 family phage major capsid protein